MAKISDNNHELKIELSDGEWKFTLFRILKEGGFLGIGVNRYREQGGEEFKHEYNVDDDSLTVLCKFDEWLKWREVKIPLEHIAHVMLAMSEKNSK